MADSDLMFVEAAAGRHVRDPRTLLPLPKEGGCVPRHDPFWAALLHFGDVVEVAETRASAPGPEPAPKPAPEQAEAAASSQAQAAPVPAHGDTSETAETPAFAAEAQPPAQSFAGGLAQPVGAGA